MVIGYTVLHLLFMKGFANQPLRQPINMLYLHFDIDFTRSSSSKHMCAKYKFHAASK